MIPNFVALVAGMAIGKLIGDIFLDTGEMNMFDCNDEVRSFHDKKVALPTTEQTEMRGRRDTNRDRLKLGLEKADDPKPIGCHSQGSYAMKTMIQHPDKDYDIDDGVYFKKEKLEGPKGGDMSARNAKEMVRNALHDERFGRAPEVRTNCVRVYYNEGYHIDVPVYRRVKETSIFGGEKEIFEVASGDWKESDPRAVTKWFEEENESQSPEDEGVDQFRRVTRYLKSFARSRESWSGRTVSGFIISKLVQECFRPNARREDKALYDTMVSIRDRLNGTLVVMHPILDTPLTNGHEDGKAKFFREKLDEAISKLEVLLADDCTSEKAMKAWDKAYSSDFFVGLLPEQVDEDADDSAVGLVTILKEGNSPDQAVDKQGGGRYA